MSYKIHCVLNLVNFAWILFLLKCSVMNVESLKAEWLSPHMWDYANINRIQWSFLAAIICIKYWSNDFLLLSTLCFLEFFEGERHFLVDIHIVLWGCFIFLFFFKFTFCYDFPFNPLMIACTPEIKRNLTANIVDIFGFHIYVQ